MEMEEPFIFGETVNPAKLPEHDAPTPVLQDSLLFGWGYDHVNGTVAEILQKVDISVYPVATCKHYFASNFSEVSHICAGGGGKGQCSGDSGSALTVDGVQYGIVSWSDKPCATTPGVMTRVASFRNWIADHAGI
ncbi:hypothetical protein NQ318_012147 [Aromia moschata]|uniref:Peptidase S1 domain-containing protein n=1 Tax=Aromia moschata TaxID=1265417 RepID=A0AAV8Z1N5_9CUCU|nr:hypothetical protein NQ318_012147 [Aromia moschata]